jgi:predicted AlkP superfamily pyrophosphatase or phosphodiesterase
MTVPIEKDNPNIRPIRLLTEVPLIAAVFGICEAALVLQFDSEVTLDAFGVAVFTAGTGLAAIISALLFVLVCLVFAAILKKVSPILPRLIIGKQPNSLGLAVFAGLSFYGLFYLNEYLLPGKLHSISLVVDFAVIATAYLLYRLFQFIDIGPKRTVIPVVSVLVIAITVAFWAGGVFLRGNTDLSDITLFEGSPEALINADKNLVFITIDTTRADRLGCYNSESKLTPNLDSLAENGVVFERAYCVQPLTGPSHTSMFCGMRPREAGVVQNGIPVPGELDMAAEILTQSRYDTGAVIGVFVVSSVMNFDQGFRYFDDYFSPFTAFTRLAWAKIGGMLGIIDTKARIQRRAKSVTDRGIKWLDSKRDTERPFFLWLHYFDPHTPYDPPAEWANVSDADDPNIRAYDGEVAYMDNEIGRLLDYLESSDLRDNTLIIVVADHGESLGEHDYFWDHGKYLYDTETRVPLIVNGPGVPSGTEIKDIFGTRHIFELIYPLLGDANWETAYESFAGNNGAFGEALEEGEYRAMWVHRQMEPDVAGLYKRVNEPDGSYALYDLVFDPGEVEDISGSRPDLSEKLGDSITNVEKEQPPLPDLPGFDKATEDKLRDLGYLQ